MKRIWFAVMFLLIAVGVCCFEQNYISGFCDEMDVRADKALECISNNDYGGFIKECDSVKELWRDKNDILFALSGHTQLDELSIRVNALPSRTEYLYEIKSIIRGYRENNKIKLSNIL
ncbi:MAG: DUF4363 family protein [Eubacterium sp.]|nr:DUF4363 family protein [Eubacterium sp.]